MARDLDLITLGHGSGGSLTHVLVRDVFLPAFSNPLLAALGDSAVFDLPGARLAMTTDAFVVSPLFFPGGDIGRLAVNGTVNDLAVAGAVPMHLSAAFILEEGLPIVDLSRIAASMAGAAREAGVSIVTGDTKVVEKGHGDGVFVVTAGVGLMRARAPDGPRAVRPGDRVLVSGPIGDHGAVIAGIRSGMDVSGGLASDCGPVSRLVDAIYAAGVEPAFMRDPTRGGLATVLAELGRDAGATVEVSEQDLPVRDAVRGVCDLLGLDPMYLPCEGRVVVVVSPDQAQAAVEAMRTLPEGRGASVIGVVTAPAAGPVVLATRFGGRRLYDTLASEQLPRIC